MPVFRKEMAEGRTNSTRVAERVPAVRARIEEAARRAGRDPSNVLLVAAIKYASDAQVGECLAAGVRDLGENRAQDAQRRFGLFGKRARWHFIGHLQTNKIRHVVPFIDLIHSVDSIRLAAQIDREAARIGKVQEVLVEVKLSPEATKFGISPEELGPALAEMRRFKHLTVEGLMTLAPLAPPEEARPYFRTLRLLAAEHGERLTMSLSILSMGMTNDFEVAVEEGSTAVRVGSAIFGQDGGG